MTEPREELPARTIYVVIDKEGRKPYETYVVEDDEEETS